MHRRRVLASLAAAPLAAGCSHLLPFGAAQPEVWPTPQDARYGHDLLDAGSHLAIGVPVPPGLDFAVRELATHWRLPLADAPAARHTSLEIRVREQPGVPRTEAGPQGYRLDIEPAPHGARTKVLAGDLAGAFYALQSLRQLGVRDAEGLRLRPAAIRDWPLIARRGLIAFGHADRRAESIEAALALAAHFKMNFYLGPEVRQQLEEAAPLVRRVRAFARQRHIEMAALLGYEDMLLKIPEPEL